MTAAEIPRLPGPPCCLGGDLSLGVLGAFGEGTEPGGGFKPGDFMTTQRLLNPLTMLFAGGDGMCD